MLTRFRGGSADAHPCLSLSDVVFIMLIKRQLRDIAIRTGASLVKQIRIGKESIT